ncbi:MAG: Gfo/Idh/MocA family oxidoreductase [Dysgonamonadaceae bacterium]|jgi:predicted dehydrogenase|nr:Gfo/Idh/MocA family oxidoreductase [Dysgonamonadaceae bacterium]
MNRREFIKEAGIFGAAGLTLSLFPWLESCTDSAKKEITGEKARLAIIGTGSRGLFHLNNLLALPEAEIVALCDTYQPHLDQASALLPHAKCYTDYRKLLENPDVKGVIIATPLNSHASITIDALNAGKPVLCEKAMAYTIEDCKRMYDAWKSSGLVMIIGQQRLYDPKYVKAMEMIHSGEVGNVVNVRNYWFRNNNWRRETPEPSLERQINWRLYREYSRGLMTELACHQLQNGTWAMRLLPEKVMGHGSIVHWKDNREVFDNVSVIYTYPNGVTMTFESVISNKHFGMGEQILCSKGTFELSKGRFYSEEPRPRSGIRQLIGQIEAGVMNNAVFAGTSWNAETASNDPGVLLLPNIVAGDGSSMIGAAGDGSIEMTQAFCHGVITGKQPENVVEESYYASVFSLLGDEAMLRGEILFLPEEYRIDYL